MSSGGPWAGRTLHFVGIGGAGMQGWARVATQLGARVSGSDSADSPALADLSALGATVHIGHDAANVPEGAEVVYSSAVPAENSERAVAREQGWPERPRAELLRELTSLKRTIAIAGAHGKTTTTAMCAHVLREVGMDPGYLIGGTLAATGLNAEWGTGDWLVVEADESDRSMLALDVDVAVVTNVELDHHATYGSLEEVRDVFRSFLAGAPEAVLWDRPDVLDLRADGAAVVTFDEPEPRLALRVPGAHNQRNAAAAVAAAVLAGAEEAAARAAVATFAGAGRRFEDVGRTASGARVVCDYAHHPTEVAATIAAAREVAEGRVVALFQPHLFSRTAHLAAEFGAALAAADLVALLDVYPARERAEDWPGTSGQTLVETARAAGAPRVLWLPTAADVERDLVGELRPDDLLLCLGAGDIDALARRLGYPA